MRWTWVETELGRLCRRELGARPVPVDLHESTARERRALEHSSRTPPGSSRRRAQLQEYARGERHASSSSSTCRARSSSCASGTRCARSLGQTRTYGQIAAAIGEPGSGARGRAREWPQPRADRRALPPRGLRRGPGGFSGGLEWKQRLLALERVQLFA
jgi:O6-methylguanine-DNA--protein-cysteine methyltransferase